MPPARDMTRRQYLAALKRNGLEYQGFLGYVRFPDGTHISGHNAGPNYRRQLAYLLRQLDAHQKPETKEVE